MANHTIKSGYVQLVDRLNRFPQSVPPSKLLYKIIEMLFSEKAALLWKMDGGRTRKILDQLCDRAILMDIEEKNVR